MDNEKLEELGVLSTIGGLTVAGGAAKLAYHIYKKRAADDHFTSATFHASQGNQELANHHIQKAMNHYQNLGNDHMVNRSQQLMDRINNHA